MIIRKLGDNMLLNIANEIITYLQTIPEVNGCTVYGSLSNGKFDKLSDIDIQVDVSGSDNSIFVTKLPELIQKQFPVVYFDYAPSLIPEQYIVSIAVDEENPFCIVDLKCAATPHIMTLQKNDFMLDKFVHTLKLWTANCKHLLRGKDCIKDNKVGDVNVNSVNIIKMGKRIIGTAAEAMTDNEIMEATLNWLENNCTNATQRYVKSLRRVWVER